MPLSPDQAVSKVQALYQQLAGRRGDIEKWERYFGGEQPLTFASDEWAQAHARRYSKFADNWCGPVGTAPAERTELVGFRVGDGKDGPTADEKMLWADWEINEGPAQSSQGFLTTTIAKRSAALVWADEDGEPELTWEHPSQVIVGYRPGSRRREAALKSWTDGDTEFATLYLADEVWKFQRPATGVASHGLTVADEHGRAIGTVRDISVAGGGWTERVTDMPADEPWPLPNPLGVVPVVEFRNRPMLGGEPLSDIAGTVAMQDAINLLWAYLFNAADFASMPARVVMGQEPPKIPVLDANGQKVGDKPIEAEQLTRGRMLWLTGQTTTIGQWDAAKLSVFTEVINVAVRHVAAQTRTPIYLIHGELGNVNGETLTGLDAPLVSKVGESHKFYTSPIREVFALFALVRDNKALAQACRMGQVQWADAATRSPQALSDAALKDRQVGWPFAAVLERRYGLGPDEVQRYVDMANAESADPTLERIARTVAGDDGGDAASLP